jgi:mono/diheme cytochrome c family protein
VTAWRAISRRGSGLALLFALFGWGGCGERDGDRGQAVPDPAPPPAEFGTAGKGLGPYTFALPPMPAGTVARSGSGPLAAEDPAEWVSPLTAPTVEDIARGREVFRIYCAPCHGPAGHGDGPMAGPLGVTVRDLHDDAVAELSDGEIYATITQGSGQMLGLKGLISPADRWHAVLGMRAVTRAASTSDRLRGPDSARASAAVSGQEP